MSAKQSGVKPVRGKALDERRSQMGRAGAKDKADLRVLSANAGAEARLAGKQEKERALAAIVRARAIAGEAAWQVGGGDERGVEEELQAALEEQRRRERDAMDRVGGYQRR